ncbi:MAG TPA: NosD domain-containing protein, partial [Salinivirgaceae bacterium]|nr:NosD domain-containing protein [Salinivirgaceae bacterium]
MRTQVILFIWLLTSLSMIANAQINANPDPTGEPWWVGGDLITPETQRIYNNLVDLDLLPASIALQLPTKVDNSQKKYFRTIFYQDGNSCAQAAGVGYVFTYMVNRLRNLPSGEFDYHNLYPTHYTWNYLNYDGNYGSYDIEGWWIIRDQGISNVHDYGGLWKYPDPGDEYRRRIVWPHGYENYERAMKNRVEIDIRKIDFSNYLLHQHKLDILKHWLYDCAKGDTILGGGLATISVNLTNGIVYGTTHSSGDDPGRPIVTKWGKGGAHAMTIVGYNDNVKYWLDNKICCGAVKLANSHGKDYPNEGDGGFVYMPYELLWKNSAQGGILRDNIVRVIKVEEHPKPIIATMRLELEGKRGLQVWTTADTSWNAEFNTTNAQHYYSFNSGSKDKVASLRGDSDDAIEISLDISELCKGKFLNYFGVYIYHREIYGAIEKIYVNKVELVMHEEKDTVTYDLGGSPFEIPAFCSHYFQIPYSYIPSQIDSALTLTKSLNIKKYVTITGDVDITDTAQIVVEKNGTLHLQNNTVQVMNDKTIIVKPGGKLIVDGAKLTNSNGNLWQGIELHGNKHAPQNPKEQPIVELKNGAIIENAVFGVFADNRNNQGNYGGGIIYADSAIFKDCHNGIVMQAYRNYLSQNPNVELNNLSYIKQCTFEITNNFDFSIQNPTAIKLWDVSRVSIFGNTFVNNVSNDSCKHFGNGIVLINAKATICAFSYGLHNTNKIPNTFTNLKIPINVLGSDYTNIVDNVFENNYIAIANGRYSSGIIRNNSINVPPRGYGIYATPGNNFKIEQNEITGQKSGVGIVAESTTLQELYKNSISDMEIGIYASENPYLKFNCNILQNNGYQLMIAEGGAFNIQGSDKLPTGNQFFPDCYGTDTEIYKENINSIMLYYHFDAIEHEPLCNNGVWLSSTTHINQCPDRNPGGDIPSERELMSLNEDIESGNELLSQLVDGGDTPALVQTIEDAEGGEEYNLLNELLDKSPFLSEEVLVTTASEEEVLPNLFIANVLEANPQAAKSSEVQEALDNRTNQMPDYLREIIDRGLDLISAKEEIEMQIAEKVWQREVLLSDLISHYLNDSTADRSPEAEALMLAENTLYYDYMMINRYLSNQRFTQAQELFGSLPTKYNLDSLQLSEYNQMSQIIDIHVALGDGNYFNLSAEQKSILYQLAEDTKSQAGSIARAILVLVDQARFPLPEITLPTEDGGKGSGTTVVQKNEFIFSVNPNPAEDYFIVKYNLATKVFENAELRMFNNKGVEVYQQQLTKPAFEILVATDKFEPGVYLCRLYHADKEVGAKPLVIKPSQIVDSQFEEQAEQMPNGKPYFFLYPN